MFNTTARAPRSGRLRTLLERQVADQVVPGLLAVVSHRGRVQVESVGTLAFHGPGADTPMATDTIVRLGSMSKPLTAACAMTLIEDCTLRLDDPVDDLLPELADMQVLVDPHGPLDQTVPAERPITVRDLLDFTLGIGMVLGEGEIPIAAAMEALGDPPLDELVAGLGRLPLAHQPGERWLYHTGSDLTGALIQRATGQSFGDAMRRRIFGPLGMHDSGFWVPAPSLDRLATAYAKDDGPDGRPEIDDAPSGAFARPPVLESGGGGMVTTADDYLAFTTMLLNGGVHQGERLLSSAAVDLMTRDHLSVHQRTISGFHPRYFESTSWGFGMGVTTQQTALGPSAGSYGWTGFWGTAWTNDPSRDLSAFLFFQRAHWGNRDLPLPRDFWTTVYQSLD